MNDRLRLGVVGCGRVFERFHLPSLKTSPSWELAAVCDTDSRRQQWIARNLPRLARFTSFEQMLDQSELDAVLIATPPRSHKPLTMQAIQYGLHVLVEKPGGRDFADASALARIASAADRVIWIGFNRRFNPHYEKIRTILKEIRPNTSLVARFDLSISVVDWGSISGYLGEENEGGDVLRDVASHQLDLLSWMFSSPVISIRSQDWDRINPSEERLSYDVELKSGAMIQCLAEHGKSYREALAVEIGNKRMLSYPTGLKMTGGESWPSPDRLVGLRYWIDRKLIRFGLQADPLERSYQNQLDSFATAIRGGMPSVSGGNMDSLLMVHRAMRALIKGQDMLGE